MESLNVNFDSKSKPCAFSSGILGGWKAVDSTQRTKNIYNSDLI